MSDLFKEFKRDIRIVRRYIETWDEFSFNSLVDYLDDDIKKDEYYNLDVFNKKVLLFRLIDQNREEPFDKQSILKYLSEWEISLG